MKGEFVMRKADWGCPPPPRKELSDTPVKLCNEISRLFHAKMREKADKVGVMSQPGARLILTFLAINDGLTQRDIVNATHLRPPTVSVIITKMEEEGLAERKHDTDDMRVVRVYLTDEGRKYDMHNIERIKEQDSVALAGLDENDISVLMTLLGKIRDNLSEGQKKTGGTDIGK